MSAKTTISVQDLTSELRYHLQSLGLSSVQEYREWCVEHGFHKKLRKSSHQLRREREDVVRRTAEVSLSRKRRETRNLPSLVEAICFGKINASEVTPPYLKRLCEMMGASGKDHKQDRSFRKTLVHMLTYLNSQRVKLLTSSAVVARFGAMEGNSYIEALVEIAKYRRHWLRPIEQWKCRSHSARRQFDSLIRHLLVKYDDMPDFFDSVWFDRPTKENVKMRGWYMHVGRGQNIRHCALPISLTKGMSHHFMQAPNDLSVLEALRWAQVVGLAGDERLAREILGSRLGPPTSQEAFWETVIRWFIEHPLLDRIHVAPIIDYLHHQKYVPEVVLVSRRENEYSSPPEPNLTMKGRNPQSILRKVQDWHRIINKTNVVQERQWKPCGIDEFEWIEGTKHSNSLRCWTIRELLSHKSLAIEGKKLKHCVATYASSCADGLCSIWTMELDTFEGHKKLLTIEVCGRSRTIRQVRGKSNRFATNQELSVIRRWAQQAGIVVAHHVD